ncbi:hypothetical protein NBRC116583_29300 [Arenicella sp. 4NH20-0111]|uniref:YHS domain-containing (seleno)protein n=1 Tax=Arenicella sp. 4NH20-0111 TaxID=3127648 RepID=UPI003103166D
MTLFQQNLASLCTAISLASSPALVGAADEYNASTGLTAAGKPLGLHGVDPVAFNIIGNRALGRAEFTEVHDGVAYYFSSKANAKLFKKNPEAFIPQYGGFCTYGTSVGKKFDGDPKFSAVIDNKLYVFLNEDIFNAFQKDVAGTIQKAEKNWSKIKHTAVSEL